MATKQPPAGTQQRIAKMTFASVYPHYVTKVEKKGRTTAELHQVIEWLTGYDEQKLQSLIDDEVDFDTFFKKCKLHPNAHLIKGVICGYRVEELEDPLIRQTRYLDKLVDELAKGKKMEKDIARRRIRPSRFPILPCVPSESLSLESADCTRLPGA